MRTWIAIIFSVIFVASNTFKDCVLAAPELRHSTHDETLNIEPRKFSPLTHFHDENLEEGSLHPLRSVKFVPSEDEDPPLTNFNSKFKKRRSPLGIVYNDGKPIGILEPIPQLFEYQNYQNHDLIDPPKYKRENLPESKNLKPIREITKETLSDIDKPKSEEIVKPNSKSASPGEPKSFKEVEKRDASVINEKESKDKSIDVIEENLKEVMNDLGLIKDEEPKFEQKRNVQFEDEDLETGPNKIGITKANHIAAKHDESNLSKSESSLAKEPKTADVLGSDDANLVSDTKSKSKKKISDYRNEGESFLRKKRQQQTSSNSKSDGNDIVKGLESSGDLTVSGNKSPLASASATVETDSKHKLLKGENYEKRDQESFVDDSGKNAALAKDDDLVKDQRIQRNIQDKILKIKEEVKREINSLKPSGEKANVNAVGQTKRESKIDNKKARKKRNLIDKENEKLSVKNNLNLAALEPHIRQRRDLSQEVKPQETKVDVEKREDQEKQVQNSKIVGPKEEKSRTKRSSNEPKHQSLMSNFQKLPNINAAPNPVALGEPQKAHAVVARSSRVIINADAMRQAALDAQMLDQLVSESTSLSESLKSSRGVHSAPEPPPRVEVELHSGNSGKDTVQKKVESTGSDSVDTAKREDNEGSKNRESSKRNTKGESNNRRCGNSKGERDMDDMSSERDEKMKSFDQKFSHEVGKGGSSDSGINLEPKAVEVRTDSPTDSAVADEDNKLTMEQNKRKNVYAANDNADKEYAKIAPESDKENFSDSDKSEEGSLDKRSSNERLLSDINEPRPDETHFAELKNSIRQERKSEPNLSLEDMQTLDSENSNKRKRRFANYRRQLRKKRTENNNDGGRDSNFMRFRTYRGDDDEADDESDEFDDDNFDDRTSNLVRKRAAQHSHNYEDLNYNFDPSANNELAFTGKSSLDGGDSFNSHVNKRNVKLSNLVSKINADVFDTPNYLYETHQPLLTREKRQVIDDVVSLHSGGGTASRHSAAIKQRRSHFDVLNGGGKRNSVAWANSRKQDEGISSLSETDLFGGLPQSYEGELTRLKRVKRDKGNDVEAGNRKGNENGIEEKVLSEND